MATGLRTRLELRIDHLRKGDGGGGDGGEGRNGEIDSRGILGDLVESLGPRGNVRRDNGGGSADNNVGRSRTDETADDRATDTGRSTGGSVGVDFRARVEREMVNTGLLLDDHHDLDSVAVEMKCSSGANNRCNVGRHAQHKQASEGKSAR